MAITGDFSIAVNGDIRYIGAAHGVTGAGYYTVIEFHRWLQDLADEASSAGDDYMDITKSTPSDRSTDNIITLLGAYNLDDTSAEHLYGGSIIQASGATIYDGILVYANPDMDMQIQQNGAIIVNDFWNSVPFGTGLIGLNPDAANGISHRFMLKVRTGGADIDGRRIICQTRVWMKTYGEFKINGTSRGNNVAALTYANDLNNETASGTVAGWTTITNQAGYRLIDVNNDTVSEPYYSEWTKVAYSINQFYERIKYLQRVGTAETLYGLNGEVFRGITHELTVSKVNGTSFVQPELLTWSTGTGQLLATDSVSACTKMWIQILTGVAPSSGTITGASGATATCSGNIERVLSFPACGVSTGSALIGAYGFGMVTGPTGLSNTDKVFDLTGALRQAPNYVSFTVGNLVAGDRVLVAPATADVFDPAQMTLNGALIGATVTSVVVNGAIPTDTPASGNIRILRTSGFYTQHPYSAWVGSTFTITSHNFSTDSAPNGTNVFVAYIDGVSSGLTMQFTSIYNADRNLFVRVRNGTGSPPIKTYESSATLGSAGGSASTSRISDQ